MGMIDTLEYMIFRSAYHEMMEMTQKEHDDQMDRIQSIPVCEYTTFDLRYAMWDALCSCHETENGVDVENGSKEDARQFWRAMEELSKRNRQR